MASFAITGTESYWLIQYFIEIAYAFVNLEMWLRLNAFFFKLMCFSVTETVFIYFMYTCTEAIFI
jgi:hypothetical protein